MLPSASPVPGRGDGSDRLPIDRGCYCYLARNWHDSFASRSRLRPRRGVADTDRSRQPSARRPRATFAPARPGDQVVFSRRTWTRAVLACCRALVGGCPWLVGANQDPQCWCGGVGVEVGSRPRRWSTFTLCRMSLASDDAAAARQVRRDAAKLANAYQDVLEDLRPRCAGLPREAARGVAGR